MSVVNREGVIFFLQRKVIERQLELSSGWTRDSPPTLFIGVVGGGVVGCVNGIALSDDSFGTICCNFHLKKKDILNEKRVTFVKQYKRWTYIIEYNFVPEFVSKVICLTVVVGSSGFSVR